MLTSGLHTHMSKCACIFTSAWVHEYTHARAHTHACAHKHTEAWGLRSRKLWSRVFRLRQVWNHLLRSLSLGTLQWFNINVLLCSPTSAVAFQIREGCPHSASTPGPVASAHRTCLNSEIASFGNPSKSRFPTQGSKCLLLMTQWQLSTFPSSLPSNLIITVPEHCLLSHGNRAIS